MKSGRFSDYYAKGLRRSLGAWWFLAIDVSHNRDNTTLNLFPTPTMPSSQPPPSFTLLSPMDSHKLTGEKFFDTSLTTSLTDSDSTSLLFRSPLPSSLDVEYCPSHDPFLSFSSSDSSISSTQSDWSVDSDPLPDINNFKPGPHITPQQKSWRMSTRHASLRPPDSCLLGTATHIFDVDPDNSKFRDSAPMSYLRRRLYPTALMERLHHLSESPSLWLALYFFLNLSLTLYNKSVLIHFPFPYTLTALHALCGAVGTFIVLKWEQGGLSRSVTAAATAAARALTSPPPSSTHHSYQLGPGLPALTGQELVVLFLFSTLYTINIVVSNASLRLVTVPVSFLSFVRGLVNCCYFFSVVPSGRESFCTIFHHHVLDCIVGKRMQQAKSSLTGTRRRRRRLRVSNSKKRSTDCYLLSDPPNRLILVPTEITTLHPLGSFSPFSAHFSQQ